MSTPIQSHGGEGTQLQEINKKPRDPGTLLSPEIFWRDHQKWFEGRGYMLRPRYRPGWVPSWHGTNKAYWRCEDGISISAPHLLDATRMADGEMVMLKRVSRSVHPYEVQISRYFSTEPYTSHPRNHCVPIYEVLNVPDSDDTAILVMPLLRFYNDPRIKSIGEAVEYFRQVFEGLQFMHQCHVAHRDCMNLNIMMDPKPTFPKMFHPADDHEDRNFGGRAKYYTRTSRPTKYFLIDFGLSRKYDPKDGPWREVPILGGDRTVPEFQGSNDPCDPFPTDIYYIGNMIREDFLQKTRGVEFMAPLVEDMVQNDPSKRPTIDEVVERFSHIRQSLYWWTLRSRVVENEEETSERIIRSIHHFFRTTAQILMFRSPVPTP